MTSASSIAMPDVALPDALALNLLSRRPARLPQATFDTAMNLGVAITRVSTSPPRASVVVVACNNLAFTKLCLTSLLLNTELPAYELIVVDNGSTDATPSYLKTLAALNPHVHIVFNGGNRGFAAASNQGLRVSRGEMLVLLNNDTLVPPGWLVGLDWHLRDRALGLIGPVTNRIGNEAEVPVNYDTYGEYLEEACRHGRAMKGQRFEIPRPAMFCLAMRRDAWGRIGPLDEQFEVGFFEDDDYAIRGRAAGYQVACAEDVLVHHFGEASFGDLFADGSHKAIFEANRRRFESKWGVTWSAPSRRPNQAHGQAMNRAIEKTCRAGHTPMTSKRALFCSHYMPQADLDSFSRRLLHFVEFLCDAGWSVVCVCRMPAGVEQYAPVLHDRGVTVHVGLHEHIERLAASEPFDVAIVGFWHIGDAVIKMLRNSFPSTPIIVDSGDLHFLRHARRMIRDHDVNDGFEILDADFARETVKELNVYAAADAVFAVSAKEANFVNDFVGGNSHAYVVPDCEDLAPSPIPFSQRRGMFFVGNFEHLPNVEAVDFLCNDVLRQFDPDYLADHPVYIAGNGMTEKVRAFGNGLPSVHMLGWIPSVQPYLERVRVSLIPLLHGAGTKRKMIQALSIGTPTVSTSVGIEGFDLGDEQEVLVADDPVAFANAIARLLHDQHLWERLSRQGGAYMLNHHSRQIGRERLLEAIDAAIANSATKRWKHQFASGRKARAGHGEYRSIVRRIRELVCELTPAGSIVAVVSRGDDQLLELKDRIGLHFPQEEDGVYCGHHPANSAQAVAHLDRLLKKKPDFLVFPKTAFWWFEYFGDFARHLETHYGALVREDSSCVIFSLNDGATMRPAETPNAASLPAHVEDAVRSLRASHVDHRRNLLSSPRPTLSNAGFARTRPVDGPRIKVLVVGVYLADRVNNIDDIVATLSNAIDFDVVQRWAALGGDLPTPRVAAVTVRTLAGRIPKFEILNDLLAHETLSDFKYVIACDDDVFLPTGFVDQFIALQTELDLAIAQPSLTADSFINHPITEQQRGLAARVTRFVEIGPVVSFHESVFALLFPFDLTSPMGWGYELIWASELGRLGQRMGVIDATPVSHSFRESVSNYDKEETGRQQSQLLGKYTGLNGFDRFQICAAASWGGGNGKSTAVLQTVRVTNSRPRISVIIPTHNRSSLLDEALASLSGQTLPTGDFEVVVVDDGSNDSTTLVCKKWSSSLELTYLQIQRSGIAAAKNLGVFASGAPILFFFDDDDIAEPQLLEEHLKSHERYPLENIAVLGYTDWETSLNVTEVMRFITDIGHYLFSYTHLIDGQSLDFTYFWGGRSSCKKSLLTKTGVFGQEFEFGSEDIELGFRISKQLVRWRWKMPPFSIEKDDEELKHRLATAGLAVIFNRKAAQHMNRPITYDEFCRRCERQGKSQMQFARRHSDSIIQDHCQVENAFERWAGVEPVLSAKVGRVHEIESILQDDVPAKDHQMLVAELHQLYWFTFDAFKIKGIVEGQQ